MNDSSLASREGEVISSADRRLAAHYAVTRVLAESVAIDDATQRILQLVCETLGWEVGEFWRMDCDQQVLRCQARWHLPALQGAELDESAVNPARGGLAGRVCDSGRPLWLEDVLRETNCKRCQMAAAAGIHTAVGFPIQLGRRTLGAYIFFSRRMQPPDDYLLQMMGTIGHQFGQFIERMRAEKERAALLAAEQRARREAEAKQRQAVFLAEASAMLSSSLDYQATLGRVARLAVPQFANWCIVDVVEEGGRIHRVAISHPDPDKLARARDIDADRVQGKYARYGIERVLCRGSSAWIRRISKWTLHRIAVDDEHLRFLQEMAPTSCIIAPMVARGRILGAITFVAAGENQYYSREDLTFAKQVARRAAVAVDNARLYQEAQAARESAEMANRLKDEFLANLSHELRTPLTPMLGWIGMLRTGKLDSEVSMHGLHVIERNIKTQSRLIDDLLDVSRIITGKLRLNVRTSSIVPIIQQAVDSVQPAADAKNIRMSLRLEDAGANVAADPDRLQQVLWNLLTNAIKFTPADGEVRIGLKRNDAQLELTVTDTGEGIEPAFLPFVFERFRQADSTATRRYGGLGLGLSIVRHIVELHGGTVTADSDGVGKGATLTVLLPIAPNGAVIYLPTEIVCNKERRLDGIHVLVVDDEGDTLDWIAIALKQFGARVSLARTAAKAAEIIRQDKPDVLIADVGLPDEDGFSLIARLRARGSSADLPAIALTAYAQHEDKRRALEAGFHVHLSKPIEPEELAHAIARLIQTEASRSQTRASVALLPVPNETPYTT